jgi:hypothetical protein
MAEGDPIATVERKTFETSHPRFQTEPDAAAVGAASGCRGRGGTLLGLFKLKHVSGAWLAEMLARLQMRYPEVQVVFADSRKFAEEWCYRFLAAALADSVGSDVAK